MKSILSLTTMLTLLALLSMYSSTTSYAQTSGNQFGKGAALQHGPFDDDGDGIPNGQDPDYVRPANCTGKQLGHKNGGAMNGIGKGNGFGGGNRNGKGIGPGCGTGVCDGTGPKGKGRGGN